MSKKYVSLEKLSLYDEKIKKFLADADAAVLQSAKNYCDSKDDQFDAAGSANTAKAEAIEAAKTETTNQVTALANGTVKSNTDAIAAIKDDANIDSFADVVAELAKKQNSGDYATKAEAQGYANSKDDAIAEAKAAADKAQEEVDALEQTHATDKAALENKDSELAAAINTEKERAMGVEGGLEDRIETMESFCAAAQADGTDTNVIDTLKEIQEYIASDETGASAMASSIKQNSDDISDVKGRLDTAEDKLDTVAEGAQVNVIETVKVNGVALSVSGKAVDVVVPTGSLAGKNTVAESDLDTALATKINGMTDASELQTAIGNEATRVDGLLANKVDKVTGKGLSTNDLTNDLKSNYDTAYTHSQTAHAPADAQANVIESVKVNGTALTVTGKAVDITVPTDNASLTNGAGYLVASDIANKADKGTTLAHYGITDAYTNAQTDTAIANAMAQFEECTEADINSLFA